MYLSRIELHGFKSFADRTTIEFSDGLTAIVGPNGSGKTNIVDAIRWVLGEQKTSLLRTDGMSQVIFNGTRTRKPLGMAEVSITIENTKKILPAEFAEVVVTRRLFRDGESQYLLNGSICRRKDIVDLFTDTGMGADAYSVIELKMVEQILEDHSDERRHLFEEAAGIVKYKQRRKETIAKLEATKADIERIVDHITEVRRTVASLKRQAERAERYQALTAELRSYELERHRRSYWHYTGELDTLQVNRQHLDEHHRHCAKYLVNAESSVHTINDEIARLEQLRQSLFDEEQSIATQHAATAQDAAVLQERIQSAAATLESLIRDVHTRTTKRDNIEEELERCHSTLAQLQREQDQLHQECQAIETSIGAARVKLAELRQELERLGEPLRSLDRDHERITMLRTQLRRTVEEHRNRIHTLNAQLDELNTALEELTAQRQQHQTLLEQQSSALAQLEQQLRAATLQREQLENTIEQLRLRREQLNSAYAHAKAQHTLLASIIEHEQPELLPSEDIPIPPVTPLGDLITIPDQWAIALESALRGMQNFVVVETRRDADALAQWLHQHHRSKVHIICKELIPSVAAPRTLTKSLKSTWLSQLAIADEPIASLLHAVLSGIATCSSLDEADALFAQEPRINAVVDPIGQIRYRTGILRVGHALQTEGLSIGRAQRMSAIEQELSRLEQERAELEQELRSALQERDAIALEKIIEQLRTAERALHEHNRTIEQLNLLHEQLQREKHQRESERKAISDELTALAADDAALDEQSRKCDRERVELLRLRSALEEEIHSHDAQLTLLEERLHNRKLDAIRLRSRIESVQDTIARLETERDSLDSTQEMTITEQEQLRAYRTALEAELAANLSTQAQLQKTLDDIRAQRRTIETQLSEQRALLAATHQQILSLRTELEQLTARRHELDLEHERLRIMRDQLVEYVQSTYNCDLASLAQPDNAASEELETTIAKLQTQIAALGAINFSALEQYTEEKQRLDQLEKQFRDLQSAEANLRDTIAEINTTASQRFLETLEAIRRHFKELFALLFHGDGEADLIMDGDDPLEARINIIARPRGKRPLSIEMLSGGEKTLTAIALLFAIYLVKPSPFCILDEVDAPLDDANIDRYLQLIRRFSQSTQFLLITHNKRTMEAADILYGVTMQEPGVSKIVSVRLSDPETVSQTENAR